MSVTVIFALTMIIVTMVTYVVAKHCNVVMVIVTMVVYIYIYIYGGIYFAAMHCSIAKIELTFLCHNND